MMIDDLKTLQKLVKQLTTELGQCNQELAHIKSQPQVPADKFDALSQQYATEQQAVKNIQAELSELTDNHKSLTTEYEALVKKYQGFEVQLDAITQERDELAEKNRISSKRAQVVLERLAKLDQEEPAQL